MNVMTTYNIGHKIPKWENVMMILLKDHISKIFLSLGGENDINNQLENFDMALILINIQVDVIFV